MALYMVSGKQTATTAFIIAATAAACAFFIMTYINYLDLPDVYVGMDNKCVKVVNYKNGDAYTCQDKDVVLRKYNVVRVQ